MGMQLNFGDHHSKVEFLLTIPAEHRAAAQWARSQARVIAQTVPSANAFFLGLPIRRTLTSLLADSQIWVSYIPMSTNILGFCAKEINEIGIQYNAFRSGKKTVLATLIHELAHMNGTEYPSLDAELAVYYCGLGTVAERRTGIDDPSTPYTPGLKG